MSSRVTSLALALVLLARVASAEITIRDGAYFFNGFRKERVVGRSSFKLANHVTYHFTGQGGGHYGLGSARRWVDWNQDIGFDILRVLLETAGWDPECEPAELSNNGKPDDCMFGSEPADQGFWDVDALRRGGRPTDMHGVGKNTLRWFFETSQEVGMAFELVIVATLKHDDVSVGQQTHVIRQTMSEARELQIEFPRANVLMSGINEYNAHSQWTLAEVNLLAVRNDRCKHTDGRTAVALVCPPGFEPEQWPGGPFHVDAGGGNFFDYRVGSEPGAFRSGWVHPSRDSRWASWPNEEQRHQLCDIDSRGQPCGASESMFYVEVEDRERGQRWGYRGETYNWQEYRGFIEHAIPLVDYFIIHDEKGVETLTDWPRPETRVEKWARDYFDTGSPPPPPDPDPDPDPDPEPPSDFWIVDADTRCQTKVQRLPEVRYGIMRPELVLDERYEVDGKGRELVGVWVFQGVDPDDTLEISTSVYADGIPVALSSPHKETLTYYDAWKWFPNYIKKPGAVGNIVIDVTANVTGPNEVTPRPEGKNTARPHFGIWLLWRCTP